MTTPRWTLFRTVTALALTGATVAALSGCSAGSSAAKADSSAKTVTVYTADGLNDGDDSYYQTVFAAFEKETGIDVKVVEAGSGEVLQRVKQESSNTQADLLVTLPPFIQTASGDGLLAKYAPEGSDAVPDSDKAADGTYEALVNNYIGFIRNTKDVPDAPGTWDDLLDDEYQGKLQYSTPGVAGDGTAMLMLAREVLGAKQSNAYFTKLQDNNVGPSDSTGALAAKVDKGELTIANGDVQMNNAQQESMPNLGIFFLAGEDGAPTTMSVPYSVGLVKDAPHTANAKKLLDFLYTKDAQEQATTVAGGFPARSDVHPTGDEAEKLDALMDGVEIVHPDWDDIAKNLDSYVGDWNTATGTL